MSTRLTNWVKEQVEETGSEYAVVCGLQNGDVKQPGWVSSGYTAIGFCVWDNAESDGQTKLYQLDETQPIEE